MAQKFECARRKRRLRPVALELRRDCFCQRLFWIVVGTSYSAGARCDDPGTYWQRGDHDAAWPAAKDDVVNDLLRRLLINGPTLRRREVGQRWPSGFTN